MAKELADHRQRHAARNEQRREGVAQIMDADGGQFGLFTDILPKPLDVLKRLAFDVARKHPLAISGHPQPDRAQQRGGGSTDRRAMQAALLRGGRRLDPDSGFQIELIPSCAQHFAASRAGEQDQAHCICGAPVRMGIERGGQPLRSRQEMIELLQGVVEHGTGQAASMPGGVAGKTGTSQDYRDAWFIGFTDELVVGVWVGNDDRSPMKGVTGGSLPARTWKRFVRKATPLLDRPDIPVLASGSDEGTQARDAAPASCDVAACESAYHSFRASDCTYQPYRGRRRICEKTSSATSDRRNSEDRGSYTEAELLFPFASL